MKERFRGCLLGLAVGDAVGTTVEFQSRGTFTPVTDLLGGGPFGLPPGAWTDDTSMALCLATSLLACQGFDARDQMDRYCRWWLEGYLSSTGRCFDIGVTVAAALRRYSQSGNPFSGPTAPHTAGNGCLMRLAPVPMFFHREPERAVHYSAESSRTTHGTAECLDACRLFAKMILSALAGAAKDEILFAQSLEGIDSPALRTLGAGSYRTKTEREITGSGYVVQSLEAALWSFLTTDSFSDAVLRATNLGDDADTTAAICGQLAGAFYGESGIPEAWRARLVQGREIGALAEQLAQEGPILPA